MGGVQRVAIVVPCYNEARRLSRTEFLRLSRMDGVRLIFVDDGSTDRTAGVLDHICEQSRGRAQCLSLAHNQGKAEAVRQGLIRALGSGVPLVGFLDADLSTPVDEYMSLVDRHRSSDADVVMGARIQRSGGRIERTPVRLVMGKVFAALASVVLRTRFRDTQCGAKVFRSTDLLREVLEEPFLGRWVFDVELLGRMLTGTSRCGALDRDGILEVPLGSWFDAEGSKMKLLDAAEMATELVRVAMDLERCRRRMPGGRRTR